MKQQLKALVRYCRCVECDLIRLIEIPPLHAVPVYTMQSGSSNSNLLNISSYLLPSYVEHLYHILSAMHAKNVTEMKKKIPSPHCDLRLHLQIKIQHQLLVCKQMFCWEGIPWSCFYLAVDVAEYFDVELLAFTNDCVFPWTPFRRSQTASIFLTWPGYFGRQDVKSYTGFITYALYTSCFIIEN